MEKSANRISRSLWKVDTRSSEWVANGEQSPFNLCFNTYKLQIKFRVLGKASVFRRCGAQFDFSFSSEVPLEPKPCANALHFNQPDSPLSLEVGLRKPGLDKRGFSSVGRASALQAECHRFESGNLHQVQQRFTNAQLGL